jgi:hypothetical protein
MPSRRGWILITRADVDVETGTRSPPSSSARQKVMRISPNSQAARSQLTPAVGSSLVIGAILRVNPRPLRANVCDRTACDAALGVELAGIGQRWPGLERVMGIEPTLAAWEAAVLPLNYTRTMQKIVFGFLSNRQPVHFTMLRTAFSIQTRISETGRTNSRFSYSG